MRRSLALFGLLAVLIVPSPAWADEVVDGSPHGGMNDFVYCAIGGTSAYVEGEDWAKRALTADEIAGMKKLCVREALWGGHALDYWTLPVTDADIAAAQFVVYTSPPRHQ